MSVKSLFLDKRVLKSNSDGVELKNLKNVLDLKQYVQDVVDGYSQLDTFTISPTHTILDLNTIQTNIITNGLDTTNVVHLPDGEYGQIKIVSLKTKVAGGDNVQISPTHQLGGIDTLYTSGIDTVILMFTTFGWAQLKSYID
jgi:hypothetical protein